MINTSTLSIKLAILAPVPESFLRTAILQIYPTYRKVTFGANKVGEMQTIKNEFLQATKYQGDVHVYIYEGGYAQYKGILIDEFRFYNQVTAHPDPWGSWNISFKSYYTVKDIVGCNIPLNRFRSFLTGKIIENVRRPLRVIDP
jgi:hypothetical protein